MPSKGWAPFAVQHPSGPYGYPLGAHGQNAPIIFVDHIMDGYKSTLDDDAWRAANWVSVHFGIGRNGSVSQYASIFDASWGNGTAASPALYDRSNTRLALLETQGSWLWGGHDYYLADPAGGSLLNKRSISIEHEGFPSDIWTSDMIEADLMVKRWCLDTLTQAGVPMAIGPDMLVGHYQIDAVNRANCPGPNWPRDQIYAGISGGEDDDMIRLNGQAAWWHGRLLQPSATRERMRLDIDFPALPATARWVVLEVFTHGSGKLIFEDRDGSYAGQVGGTSGNRAEIRVRPGWDRCVLFHVEGAPLQVEVMGILGYS